MDLKTKLPIKDLGIGQQFRTTPNNTPIYVVMEKRDGQVGYRHLITDFPDKVHHWTKAWREVYPC